MKKQNFLFHWRGFITALLCVITISGFAQTKTVQGTVTDAKNEPIIGASVIVTGTGTGTNTNSDGRFTLPNVPENATLTISYVGMIPQTISTVGKTVINVSLQDDHKMLNEVIVVGYGTQTKANLTGSVQTIDAQVLSDRPLVNTSKGLQGIAPNLNISFGSGDPTAATKINIRGATSINGGTALVLVDGVETDINTINPQDIANVSILKDAASAAVYGPRGSFGVVLITTKRGALNQKLQINYNNNFSWSSPSRLPKGMAADRWLETVNQTNINNGGGAYFSAEQIAAVKNHIADPTKYPSAFVDENGKFTGRGQWGYAGNTDWFKAFYKDAAYMQQHNISLSGGSDKSTYYGSIGYKGQDGLFAFGNDKYNRTNVAFNFTTQVAKWLNIGFNTKYNGNSSDTPTNNFGMGSPYYEVYRMFPHIPVYLPNGDFAGLQGDNFNYNIAGRMALAGRTTKSDKDFWMTGNFTLTPLQGLSIKGDYTQNYWFRYYKEHKKTIYQTQPTGSPTPVNTPNGVWEQRYTNAYRAFNIWGEYQFDINKEHNFKLMAGYNDERKDDNRLQLESQQLFANEIPNAGLAKQFINVGEPGTSWAVKGLFYRINYDYKSKYLLEVNGRYDGSSKYPVGKQWGFFPSVSAAWRISEENFYEPIKPYLEYLKLRGSYGVLGNQVTTGNFDYISYLTSGTYNYVLNGAVVTGLNPATMASDYITWEKVNTKNFGLDFAMLNNRLTGSFDYYIRNTTGMVVKKTYPAVLGVPAEQQTKQNLADMRTNGWEVSLNWQDKIQNVGGSVLTYGFGIGVSDAFSTITKYDNPTKSLADDFYEGKRLGEIWGYVTDGFIKDDAEATLMATTQGNISKTWKPGDIRYLDLDGKPGITRGANTVDDPGDRKIIGNNTPRYRFNINANVGWQGFDLRALFEGVAKRDIWLDNNVFWGYYQGIWWTSPNDYVADNSWSPTNTNAYYPLPTWSNRSKQVQTKYLQNAAFIRLRDLTLSYSIPKSLVSKINLSQARVFVSGQNLFEITKMYKYMDPDITGKDKNNGEPELSDAGRVYPFSRTISFGLNLTF